MTPGYHRTSPMKVPSNLAPSPDWEPFPVDASMNLTDVFQNSPINSRQTCSSGERRNSATREASRGMTSLGEHLGRRLVTGSRASAAKSLSGVESKRRLSVYDTPSRSSRHDYDESKSLGDISEMKRRDKKEKKKSASKKTSKKDKAQPNIAHSRSMGDLPSSLTSMSRDTNNANTTRRKLSTIQSQRQLSENQPGLGEMERWGNGSFGDSRSVLSASVVDTPQELARRRLMMQQKTAIRRQSETLEKEKTEEPSLEAFLSKNRSDDSDEAAGSGDADDDSDDNDTFFSMFQWSAAESEKKKKSFSGSRSVGGGGRSVTGSSRRSLTSGQSVRGFSGSKSVSGGMSGSRSVSAGIAAVSPSLVTRKNSTLSMSKPEAVIARSKSDAETLNASTRQEQREKRKSLLLGELYNGSGSSNLDDSGGLGKSGASSMDDLSKAIISSVKESSREERRLSRRENRASLEKAYASAADVAGINSTDDGALGPSKSPRRASKSRDSFQVESLATINFFAGMQNDDAVNLPSNLSSHSPRDNRSIHSRRKLADDTDNDTVSRSTHSRRKDETKEERKERKKAEKAAGKEEKNERRASRKIEEHGDGEDQQSPVDSAKGLSRRRSSSKHIKTDSEEVSKTKKKKKESRRKSDETKEGLSTRRSKSVAAVRDDVEKVSRRRSKSTSAPREDIEQMPRRSSKSILVSRDHDEKAVIRRSKSVSAPRDNTDEVPRRRSKSTAASQDDEGLTKQGNKSVTTIGSKKSRSSSKRRKSTKSKAETEVTEADSTNAGKMTVLSPEDPMNMSRTTAFDEDSGDDESLAAPKIEPIQTYYNYDTNHSYLYEANVQCQISDGGDATVVVLSDTDDEDNNSHVSQIQDGELQRFYASCSSDDMLDDILLQFDPSESDNIERIDLQNLDASQTEGIMAMPETSFSRINADTAQNSTTEMPSRNRSLTRVGSTLTPLALGRHKSMKRLIKRTAGTLFRREKSAGDDDASQSPHPRGYDDEGDTLKESDAAENGNLPDEHRNDKRPPLLRRKSGKGGLSTDHVSEVAPRKGVKSPKSPRALSRSRSKSVGRQRDRVHGSSD
jgi:hypothetical protein